MSAPDNQPNEPVTTLVASQPADVEAPTLLTPEQAALAWIDHVQKGGNAPDAETFVGLLQAILASRAPHPPVPMASRVDDLDVRLVRVDTGIKFPHMRDTDNGRLSDDEAIWTQCKTKMTHIAVRLVDSNGRSVKGSDIQEGGLRLRLTLHQVSDHEAMDDTHNPRPGEGLFRGRADAEFDPEVTLTESRHEFRFKVLLLSSDIVGARMFVKVAPVDPQLALNPKLVMQSRSFVSRARMPDESFWRGVANNAKRARAAGDLLSMAMTMADEHAAAAEAEAGSPPESDTEARAASPASKRHRGPEPAEIAKTDTTPPCASEPQVES